MSSFRQGKLGNQPLWKSFLMGTDPCNDLVCPAEKREDGGGSPICLFCKLIKDGLGRGNLALEGEPDLRPGKLGIASEKGERIGQW